MTHMLFAAVLAVGSIVYAAGGCGIGFAQQARNDLYRCEGCEAIHERSFDDLTYKTTIPDADEPGDPLILSGTVYRVDGKTPAPGVILYAYQTNADGVYPTTGKETGWGRRHGYLRGWVKTDSAGRYLFRTIRPGSYPGRDAPAHIHMIVKEPHHREYWIDDVVFKGDPHLGKERERPRGGSGVVDLERSPDGVWNATRDITLERHPD